MVTAPDPHLATPAGKPRARALGVPFARLPGRWNAITDVPGVEVGYATLIEGDAVRTGVTAIHPRGPKSSGDNPMRSRTPTPAPDRSSPWSRPTRRCSRTSARRWPGG